jgi:CO/xanthine dehydrogenase FAD-binding subunit
MKVNQYYKAATLEDAYKVFIDEPGNAILGGGLWLKKINGPINKLVDLNGLGLDFINETSEEIIIGAMTTLRHMETHPSIINLGQGFLSKASGSIMGVALRNMVTIGGCLAGKYPFSDIITPLLTLDVSLSFFPDRTIDLPSYLQETGKLKTILTKITIKKRNLNGFFKKISVTPLDFAILNMAISAFKGDIRIAVGSRPGVGQLAIEASKFLSNNSQITEDDIQRATEMILKEITFLSTNAASAEYRIALAKAHIKRGLMEVLTYES